MIEEFEYFFDDVESCECIGEFDDEYVYDIEMDDPTHTFIANDILVHNSLYISYENLLKSIDGIENMSLSDKTKIIVEFNTGHLDQHNREFMKEYYKSRYVDSVQNFELETVALSGVWLDVKKRYAQILLWKDGKTFDRDDLPMKVKGLEIIKASYPKAARQGLKSLVRELLEDEGEGFFLQRLNIAMQREKQKFFNANFEDMCENKGVQNYTKYILDDTNMLGLKVAPKCPYNVRALGQYNRIRNAYNLPGDPLYGGKMKIYCVKTGKQGVEDYFAFQSRRYPKWAEVYAPMHKEAMFTKFLLDPFNRILEAINLGKLNSDGSIQFKVSDGFLF